MQQTLKAILIAVIIIIVICLIAYAAEHQSGWAHLDYWKAHFIEEPDQIYERSAGGYDEAAELALHRSEGALDPTPADHLRAATIIHRNILSQEHRPRIETDGQLSAIDRELSSLRQDMFGRAREHYMSALIGLTDRVIARDEADRATRRFGLPAGAREEGVEPLAPSPRGEIPGHPGAEFIINEALEFAFGGLETLVNNDPLQLVLFTEEWRATNGNEIFGEFEITIVPDGEMTDLAQDRHHVSIQTRQAAADEVAKVGGGGRGVRTEAFLNLSQRATSDSQNSHDPSVNSAKRAIITRLRADQGPYERLPTLDQIIEEIRRGSDIYSRDPRTFLARPALTEKAIAVICRARNGERSASAQATDEEVLRRIWARADDSRNSKHRDLMHQASYDALVDSWERGMGSDKIQCVDGRISRMIGSLTLLDWDENNWKMRRLEQHKNDIYTLVAETIRTAATEAADQDADAALQTIGRSYLATSQAELSQIGEVDDAKEKAWIDTIKVRASQVIDTHLAELDLVTPGVIPKHVVDGIKMEALAALTI